jgi:hypothetical protein
MADRSLGQAGLIVVDQRYDVPSRDIAVVDDREAGAAQVEMNVRDFAGGNRGSEGAGVKKAREGEKREIVDVLRLAGDLRHAFFAKHIAADCAPSRHRGDYMLRNSRWFPARLDHAYVEPRGGAPLGI